MSQKTIAQRLGIKENHKVLFINEPKDYRPMLGELPKGASISNEPTKSVDLIQIFVTSKKELGEQLGRLKSIINPKTILWISYPKGTSKIKTDINRDIIREFARSFGLQAVAMISVDDMWSALRVKIV